MPKITKPSPEPSANGHATVKGKYRSLAHSLEVNRTSVADDVVIGSELPGRNCDDGAVANRDRRVGRVRRDFLGYRGLTGEVIRYFQRYAVLSDTALVALAAWVIAAWLIERFDRFPHVCISSPEKRCGKTTLLDLLALIVPKPRYTTNISPAALYRVVELEKPTLLMDESQSLARRGSEASETIREILNAGIGRNAKVIRCGGKDHDQIAEFSVYSPKVFAMIGEPDAVLADRSLPIPLKRKSKEDTVERFRSRIVEGVGHSLAEKIDTWCNAHGDEVASIYDQLEPFDIANDRMAELLVPLQAVLKVDGCTEGMEVLQEFAVAIDERDREQEMQSPGVRLLAACRDLFGQPVGFLSTDNLLQLLHKRSDEPWHRWNRGEPMTREALANLLRPFGIRPGKSKDQKTRGYARSDFEEPWERYLPSARDTPRKPV